MKIIKVENCFAARSEGAALHRRSLGFLTWREVFARLPGHISIVRSGQHQVGERPGRAAKLFLPTTDLSEQSG